MLAYAAHRRRIAERHSAPHAMLVIIAAHIALIAAVMSARMDLPVRLIDPPIVITQIPIPLPPPEDVPAPPMPSPIDVDRVPPIVLLPQPSDEPLKPPVVLPVPGGAPIGSGIGPEPPRPFPNDPVRFGPRFATPSSAVRPPYPPSKIQSEEEARLKLRLSIDPRGRVVAVEPVEPADPAFLAAARRHLLARWRYRPATVDGRSVASSTLITLRFELE